MTNPKIIRSPEHDLPEVSADSMWAALRIDRTPCPLPSWWEIFEHLWNTQGGKHRIETAFPKIRAATHYVSTSIFHMNVAHFIDEPCRDEHGNPCTVTERFAPHLSRYVGYADEAWRKAQANNAAHVAAEAASKAGLLAKLNAA